MEINKQLFEDVLSGKLKGTFLLRNEKEISSDEFIRNITYISNGLSSLCHWKSYDDIVDFIPETDMKQNELTIEIPDGKIVDWDESKKQEKIVFKKIDTKPRSWTEYCTQQAANNKKGYYFNDAECSFDETSWRMCSMVNQWRNVLPSKELAEAFLAMMQLMSLRQAWIGDWEPDWNAVKSIKWCITQCQYEFKVNVLTVSNKVLSFPTKEMAVDFMDCFKDLLEIAKPLI